jgi:hypothetical protein
MKQNIMVLKARIVGLGAGLAGLPVYEASDELVRSRGPVRSYEPGRRVR